MTFGGAGTALRSGSSYLVPFTLSHPAAAAVALPLARRGRIPFAAVVAGTMSPDFEFFFNLRPVAHWSHTLAGLFGFSLPVGLLTYVAWDLVMRGPTRHLLGLDSTLGARPPRPDARWALQAVAGVFIGAVTHLAWDGVTHGGYWGATLIPALRDPALTVGGVVIPWFNVLQHVSTVVGGLVVLAWLARELRRVGALRVLARSRWRWVAVGALLGASLVVALLNGARAPAPVGYWYAQLWLGRVSVGAMLGFGAALFAYGLVRTLGASASSA